MEFLDIVLAFIISGILYLIFTILIREAMSLFKVKHNSMHKASEISGILFMIAFLQFLLASIPFFVGLLGVITLVVMFILMQRFYGLSVGKALAVESVVVVMFLVLTVLLSATLLII